jgi:hypothetical protein
MELEADDMRVLGAIQRGANSVRFLKGIVNLKKGELEQTLDVLDESHLISSSYVSGLLGQKKLVIQITEDGTKKIDAFVTDLATLSRLNLRFLLEGKHLCYKCKKELGRFSQKFSVSSVRKFNFKLPKGMTTRDDLCADCFNGLPPAPRA